MLALRDGTGYSIKVEPSLEIVDEDGIVTSGTVIDRVTAILQAHQGLVVYHDPRPTEPTVGEFAAVRDLPLHPDLIDLLDREAPRGLYSHQSLAIRHVLDGENIVVATQTSSGKSLIHYTPVFQSLLTNRDATALFLYPQKALANDQLEKLRRLVRSLPSLAGQIAKYPYLVSCYDGGTQSEIRGDIRAQVQVALTNPDMLHVSLLQNHERGWARFFENLKYVIVDECHEYRGIFGTNVAYVLRRLRQVCEIHGSKPSFIATSATIREPAEHLEKLTGLHFREIGPGHDGSVQGRKKFWMVGSQDHSYDLGRKLALELLKNGLSVLVFCPSRVAAERMRARVPSSKEDELPFVKVYRSGLSALDRDATESGLRDGSVRLVFSTNALELGIDIGKLDAVVCVGLPSSMMSLRQRSGRVARAGKEGAIVLIPADTPIDSHYAAHPEDLFAKETEPLALNLDNSRVVKCQYACAAKEVGGREDLLRIEYFGESMRKVGQLRSSGKLNDEIFDQLSPHSSVNIRSMGDRSYRLECDGEKIGDIGAFQLLREAYRNAIYRHNGVAYRVKDVSKDKRLVRLRREYSWNETSPFIQKQVELRRRRSVAEYARLMIATVVVNVTEFLAGSVEKDRSGNLIRPWPGPSGMQPNVLPTEGTRILLRKPLWDELVNEIGGPRAKSALGSCERLIASLFPTISGPCDTQDYSSFSETLKDGDVAIYLYDMVYDGVDLTTGAFEFMDQLIDRAIERVMTCDCLNDEGCFRCIKNPHVDDQASKSAAHLVLSSIQRIMLSETPKITLPSLEHGGILTPDSSVTCPDPRCGATNPQGKRFCGDCGTKID